MIDKITNQCNRAELKKIANPNKNGHIMDKNSYYLQVTFKLDGKNISIPMKLDTGASHTIIGLKNDKLERYAENIKKYPKDGESPKDASGHDIITYKYIVEDFQLCPEVIIPKIQLYFSETIEHRAILGMDILSWFDFQYIREVKLGYGTFYLNNYSGVIENIKSRMLNKDYDYLIPDFIYSIDNIQITSQDILANYVNKRIIEANLK